MQLQHFFSDFCLAKILHHFRISSLNSFREKFVKYERKFSFFIVDIYVLRDQFKSVYRGVWSTYHSDVVYDRDQGDQGHNLMNLRTCWTASASSSNLNTLRTNLKNLNRIAEPPKPVPTERQLKSRNTEDNLKWNQPCLSRVYYLRCCSNSLNPASESLTLNQPFTFELAVGSLAT